MRTLDTVSLRDVTDSSEIQVRCLINVCSGRQRKRCIFPTDRTVVFCFVVTLHCRHNAIRDCLEINARLPSRHATSYFNQNVLRKFYGYSSSLFSAILGCHSSLLLLEMLRFPERSVGTVFTAAYCVNLQGR